MYRHTQRGLLTPVAALAGGVAILMVAPLVPARGVLWALAAVVVGTAFVFASLTTEVTSEHFAFWFGPGVMRKTFPLADVVSCTPVRNPWWYGWGIHLTPRGWLYNVAGTDAVELALRDGRTLRVGTDEPEALCHMIRTMAGKR